MTDVYPGAIWRPIDYSGHNACDELTAFTVHEAVTTAEQSVFGWVSSEGSCNVFNGRYGYCEQYIPAGVQSYANSAGNHRSFAMESFDGLKIVNDPSYREVGMGGIYGDSAQTGQWDEGQCERIADIFAWLNLDHGIPLRLMATSATSEHGIGPHRLGVPGWPIYDNNGGELWTSHAGKPCPGDMRIAQLPGIVARAQVIASAVTAGTATWLPTGNVDLPSALARGATSVPTTPPEDSVTPQDIAQIKAAINAAVTQPVDVYFVNVGGTVFEADLRAGTRRALTAADYPIRRGVLTKAGIRWAVWDKLARVSNPNAFGKAI